jgi:UDP-2,4-diacetamido-2,4,6-trideoxy-beta-L-altropyranose hydrolase
MLIEKERFYVAFRVDASSAIGTGHLMRCIALAQELSSRGGCIHFVCRSLATQLQTLLDEYGFGYSSIGTDEDPPPSGIERVTHADWLGTTQQIDAQQTVSVLAERRWDWLVVDHYALDIQWESALRTVATRIAVIDDLADRRHDCDLLLDQNFNDEGNDRYAGLVPKGCLLRIGPRFALLRDDFRKLRANVKVRCGNVSRVLVFFGGVDSHNKTGFVIEALEQLQQPQLAVDVVVGSQHPQLEMVRQRCAMNGFFCHVQTKKMANLMAVADLAIGAGGIALWERCCLGLPAMVLSTADNQNKQVHDAALRGVVYAPSSMGWDGEGFLRSLQGLLQNPSLLQFMSRQSMSHVDGLGLSRIVNDMMEPKIAMRRAMAQDSHQIFAWRNEPTVRESSHDSQIILWSDHEKWFDKVLSDDDRHLLIGEVAGRPVGVVRFDVSLGVAEVSIYITPEWAGRSAGAALLKSAEYWLKANVAGVSGFRAVVLGQNTRSIRLFEKGGYSLQHMVFIKGVN